jgi:phospholipase/carboxylesterase
MSLIESKSGLEYIKRGENNKKAIFMLHGYGASMNDLAGLYDVIKTDDNFDWIFPNGPISIPMGGMEGRAWFPIDMEELQRAMMAGEFRSFEDKEPVEFLRALPLMKTFIDELSKEYDSIIIGGFSQGAMVSSHITSENFDKQIGLILFSGTLLAKDRLIDSLENVKPMPFFQSHGKMDPVLNYNEAMKLFETLKLCRLQGEFVSFDGAHEIPYPVVSKVGKYINSLG